MTSSASDDPMMEWHALQCHPIFVKHQITHVRAGFAWRSESLVLRYEVTGDLQSINIPAPALPARRDELWRHTCAELFIGAEHNTQYAEFNFSPASFWAAYSFSDYRQGMELLTTDQPQISQIQEQATLHIAVALKIPAKYCDVPVQAGLSMVIENSDGECSYWALQHDSARPDFHRRENWLCALKQQDK